MTRSSLVATLQDALSKEGSASSDFDLNPDVILPADRKLRAAAVLIGIREQSETVILTKRSAKLKHHPGQISFPGGKQDNADTNLVKTALREANEEIGLPPGAVQILGEIDCHETVTGFLVRPIVAMVDSDFEARPELGEVEEIFEVPMRFLMNSSNFRIESRRWQGRQRHYYSVPFGPYYIWGATARMLRGLTDRMQAQ